MDKREWKLIRSFRAKSDDGMYETTVDIRQLYVTARTLDRPPQVVTGSTEAKTSEGLACNIKAENTVEVVNHPIHPGIIVRRVV